MRALSFGNIGRSARPLLGSLAVIVALALLSAPAIRLTNASTDSPGTTAATFPADAPSLGAIPDSPAGGTVCGDFAGAPKDVTFTVTGITGTITNVAVSMSITHTWVGDLVVTLRAPGGAPSKVIFAQTLAAAATDCGDDSNLTGPYNFFDTAPATPTWWNAATTAGSTVSVASGNYQATTPGGAAGGGVVTAITPAFTGVAAPNGTWTLRVHDGGAGDTGSVTAATLTIDAGGVQQHIVDFDGDGKTDPSVVRNTGGGPGGQITWFNRNSSGAPPSTTTPWGIATDFFTPEDFDGDNKTDIAVWRGGPPFGSFFYILQSATSTLRTDTFGQSGDDPTVIGDYDGDNKADPAVYRAGAMAGEHSFWYYRSSINGLIIGTEWGQNGDFPVPGDYDGDGKFDFVVQRNNGGGQARFFFKNTTSGQTSLVFGTPTDQVVPGDYDGDGKYDIATVRGSGGQLLWNILNSGAGTTSSFVWGLSATDFPTKGEWDGDGKTDIAVWRPNGDPTMNFFYWIRSSDGAFAQAEWGQNGDYPVANYNAH
jgi:proprotein convertase P-domain-containing protein